MAGNEQKLIENPISFFDLKRTLYKDVDDLVKSLQAGNTNKDITNKTKAIQLFALFLSVSHPEIMPKRIEKKESVIPPVETPLIIHPKY